MIKFIAWITGRKVVWIQDFDGEVNLRIVKETPFGLVGSRMLGARMVLNLDGTVRYPSYVKSWKYAD